jgi:phosphatidylserine/phosphatidylglycerophosphate/cardiolipin synthase-like enzyme
MNTRKIYKNATMSQNAVRDVLGMLFAREILVPGDDMFIVEPWISDLVIFDNKGGQFDSLNPEWGRKEIRLVDTLVSIACSGTHLHVHTRPEPHNRTFKERLQDALADVGQGQSCIYKEHVYLHTKGLLTRQMLLEGSMNLTERGVGLNDELVTVSFNENEIAEARVHFDTYER